MPTEQEHFMAQALALAEEAAAAGEVPVGCVIVRDGEIVGRGRNRREERQATASHAEMEAIAQANAALAKEVAPELPGELSNSKVGALLNKVATGVSALAAGTAQLTLSQETRPIQGGFILKDGNVEVNCTFETLVRLQRGEMDREVAKVLFD